MTNQFLYITWQEYHDLARKLSAAILSEKYSHNEIVAISRGGLTLGHILTDFLRIPISIISIQSYTDIKTQGEAELTVKLPTSVTGKHIILADDVADSGKTFQRAFSYLKKQKPANITTVALHYKPWSVYKPNYFAEKTKKWIIYPYEPTEMIILLVQKLQKEHMKKQEIQQHLKTIGFPTKHIAFVYKHHIQ